MKEAKYERITPMNRARTALKLQMVLDIHEEFSSKRTPSIRHRKQKQDRRFTPNPHPKIKKERKEEDAATPQTKPALGAEGDSVFRLKPFRRKTKKKTLSIKHCSAHQRNPEETAQHGEHAASKSIIGREKKKKPIQPQSAPRLAASWNRTEEGGGRLTR